MRYTRIVVSFVWNQSTGHGFFAGFVRGRSSGSVRERPFCKPQLSALELVSCSYDVNARCVTHRLFSERNPSKVCRQENTFFITLLCV